MADSAIWLKCCRRGIQQHPSMRGHQTFADFNVAIIFIRIAVSAGESTKKPLQNVGSSCTLGAFSG
jgi:hypothetical protein